MLVISSRSNAAYKSLKVLVSDPKEVYRQRRTVAEGTHLVATCLDRKVQIQQLVVSESGFANDEVRSLISRAGQLDLLILSDTLFKDFSAVATPTGIAAAINIPTPSPKPIPGDAVLLDAIQDAGNVGAILRTAAAAGIPQVLLSPGCAGAWTAKVLRAGQGAHFCLDIFEHANLRDAMNLGVDCPSLTVAAVAHEGESLFSQDLTQPVVWIFGNEGAGVSPELLEQASKKVTIPLATHTESLNVAAAAAICLFEARRQRQMS